MARSSLYASLNILLVTFLLRAIIATASTLGQTTTIPSWKVQSSSKTGDDAATLSSPELDTSAWYTIGSHGTLMAALLENKVFTDTDLFYSINLQNVDYSQFRVPWYYRSTINLSSTNGSHLRLQTNGISSRADVFLNGKEVATSSAQAGAYAGLTYDIAVHAQQGDNVILVKVYSTDYNRDFALGFVDWNPYPPDNGTGIWRSVQIKQTGAVSISSPRIVTKLDGQISVRLDVQNLDNSGVQGEVICTVNDPDGKELGTTRAEFRIAGKVWRKVTLDFKVQEPRIWWPKQWGTQPLYSTQCTASTGAGISDSTSKSTFGIRTVTKTLNSQNDTTFYVNGKPFQVIGAGYTSDIFLRFDEKKLKAQFQYVLDMGLNTIRLEGKQEHPYLYELADELGLMVMAGWECCDKWEGWSYNDEGSGEKWKDSDYIIANNSMRHEAEMMQQHPSMLAFLVGSDFWPDDQATKIYVDALNVYDWDVPIIASASQRGYPALLGNGGMKMDGPYDWVPPNYWYADQLGAAFGFGSELGAGVGTPEIGSLKKFLSQSDIDDLWKNPNKGLYHMSTNVSSFYTREIYNDALWKRYGAPKSLDDYLLKSQMMDYEATRAEFEAYAARWNAERPATGLIYWMLNNAWPSLHWNLFDYYLHPAGSYFGVKTASRVEHVSYDYQSKSVYLINHSLDKYGSRTIDIEILSLNGSTIAKSRIDGQAEPNTSKLAAPVPNINGIKDVALLRLILRNDKEIISRNVYWLSAKDDVLDWDNSTWYYTPVTSYADFTALDALQPANVSITTMGRTVMLENTSKVPAVFVRLNMVDGSGNDILPVIWSDNYVTLWPGEKLELEANYEGSYSGAKIEISGKNIAKASLRVGGY